MLDYMNQEQENLKNHCTISAIISYICRMKDLGTMMHGKYVTISWEEECKKYIVKLTHTDFINYYNPLGVVIESNQNAKRNQRFEILSWRNSYFIEHNLGKKTILEIAGEKKTDAEVLQEKVASSLLLSGIEKAINSTYATIIKVIADMSGRFQSGTYIPRTGFDWKKIMEVECLKLESWLKAKEELKLSESETEYLKQKGIVLTTMDIACIKRTEGTELVFLSKDKKALFYKGEIYPIYVPDNEISFQPIWKLDGKKEISAMEFDALEGILGFSLEEIPKEDIYTTSGHKVLSGELSSTDPNVKAAAGLSALLGLTQFTLSSLSKSEVTVIFQSSEGGNRGTICVGNSEDRATFQNWNYNIPMDTYRDSEPGIGKIWASDYAAGIYKIASGKDVPNPDGTYTITGTLDERHKDTNISGYLSYSTDGKLMYTPLTYSGDKAYIESVDGFMEFGRTQILDFSDKLSTPSFADEDSQKLLEELLKGENE